MSSSPQSMTDSSNQQTDPHPPQVTPTPPPQDPNLVCGADPPGPADQQTRRPDQKIHKYLQSSQVFTTSLCFKFWQLLHSSSTNPLRPPPVLASPSPVLHQSFPVLQADTLHQTLAQPPTDGTSCDLPITAMVMRKTCFKDSRH